MNGRVSSGYRTSELGPSISLESTFPVPCLSDPPDVGRVTIFPNDSHESYHFEIATSRGFFILFVRSSEKGGDGFSDLIKGSATITQELTKLEAYCSISMHIAY